MVNIDLPTGKYTLSVKLRNTEGRELGGITGAATVVRWRTIAMTNTSCTLKRLTRRRISRRGFLRYAGLAGLTLLTGEAATPLFEGRSNQADADQTHEVYLPLIAKVPSIPPLSQELVQEAYQFYSLGEPVPPNSLRFQFKPNLNNPDQLPIVFARDPETNEIILATRYNPETQELVWRVAKLRDLADAVGLRIGTNLSSPWYSQTRIEQHDKIVFDNFNHAVLDQFMMNQIVTVPGVFRFDAAERAIRLAREYEMTVETAPLLYGHTDFDGVLREYRTLAEDSGFLDRLGQIDWSEFVDEMNDEQREALIQQIINQLEEPYRTNLINARSELRELMVNHVRTVVNRFKGKVDIYRVANEFDINPYSFWDPYFFLVGPLYYPDLAFETAREADPDAKLTINPQGVPGPNDFGYLITLPVVRRLRERGLIDYVGDQQHINAANPPNWEEVWDTLETYGIPAYPSEVDVNLKDITGSDEERFALQAEVYRNWFRAAIERGAELIVLWECFGDSDNWLERHADGSPNADPTLFFDDGNAKPAYFAIKDELQERIDQE